VTTARVIDLSVLAPGQGFTIQGDVAIDQAGFSVSSAGDVNGDGIDDVIVGALYGGDGGAYAGAAYVIYGRLDGTRGTLDLTGLAARPEDGFIIQGEASYDYAGWSVSSAGDVNGDGIDDVIIGAPRGDDGGDAAGEAYVVYGVAGSSRGTVNLASLAAADGFIIQGDAAIDQAGLSVSSAGDVNDDGIDDMIVGARTGDDGGTDAGEAYVIYGVAGAGRGTVDLTGLTAADGFIIQGDLAGDWAGGSVSSAGDVNGDGIDDLIVGAQRGDDGGTDAGEAYVIYGVAGTTRGTVDLAALTAADGFIIQGDAEGDFTGYSVSSAGDVNGDGIGDLIVGAPHGDDGGSSAGEAYVIYGVAGTSRGTVDLTGLTAADGFIIQGDAASDLAGLSVSSAGDVNGDGIDDLIVGAPSGDDGGSSAGEAYVIYGMAGTSRGTVDLTGLTAADGFIIQGDAEGDQAGRSVSSAGDVNGDGIADVIVGAPGGDSGGPDAGASYVIYGGSASGFGAVVDLSTLGAAHGFIIQGDAAEDLAGSSVSSAGDVNGDGIDDLIVGARYGDDGGSAAGEAYVIYGVAGAARGTVDLTGLAAADGFVIQGDAAGDVAGRSVSSAGDVNGDGIDDLIIGARYGDDGGSNAGEAYVIYGVAGSTRGTLDLTGLASRPADGFIIQGDAGADFAGFSVSSAGDVNGDGIDDLIVGAPLGDDGGGSAGEAYVIYGVAGTTRGTLDLTGLAARSTDGFIIQGDAAGDRAGWSVSSVGDVNGDGIDDLIVGAPYGDDGGSAAGEAYVIYGVAGTTRGTLDLTALTATQGFVIQGDAAGDQAGWSVSSAGDVNGDGINDLIVGAPYGDDGGSNAGEAYVIYGVAGTTRGTLDLTALAAADGFIIQGDAAYDQAGFSVSSAGDVNGDGIDDLIVGARYGDDSGSNAGEAYVIFGVAGSTRGTLDLGALTAAQGFIIQGDAAYDQAGVSVSAAGDVNGDGIDDLIVGAIGGDGGGDTAGEAYVIYGRRPTLAVERSGTATGQVIFGGDLDDTINGLGGNDTLDGGAGADSLDGGTGADSMAGGTGDDTYLVDDAGDVVVEAADAGQDHVIASVTHTLGAAVERLTLSGSGDINGTGNALANRLEGNAGANTLDGGLGADTMAGGAGDDTYVVDDAADVVVELADEGQDRVIASITHTLGAGVERLTLSGTGDINGTGNALDNRLGGNAGANTLDGGEGNDTLFGDAGADMLIGGVGDDTYLVDDAADVVAELPNEGNDRVIASVSHTLAAGVERLILWGSDDLDGTGNDLDNRLDGNAGANTLDGEAGNDSLVGGLGHDVLDGGTGTDTMEGGAGDDTYVVDEVTDVVLELAGAGNDRVRASINYTLDANLERLSLEGSDDLDGTGNARANRLDGNAGANTLDGGAGNDSLYGEAGADSLIGGQGQDWLDGGTGTDTMEGGAGNDIYVVDDAADVVVEAADAGIDRVRASVSHTLGTGVERLTLFGADDIDGTGNALANQLEGNAGANTLDGGAGNDTLSGGAGLDSLIGGQGQDLLDGGTGADTMEGGTGNDIYVVDDAADVVVELAGAGSDQVRASVSHALGANLERLTLMGSADINGTGNGMANRLDGNAGHNILDGGMGNDALNGLAGNDTLTGGGGNDTLDGGAGADSMEGGLGADVFLFGSATEADGDVIADFNVAEGDRIDLRRIDPDSSLLGNQSFTWIGGADFGEVVGELRFASGVLEGDLDGDGGADFQVTLTGIATLTAANIWL
jgi:Ca2+-binding RTX toxin-like protein